MKEIKFVPTLDDNMDLVGPPIPSSRVIPDWYKKSFKFYGSNEVSFFEESNIAKSTIKGCIPVLDAISAGYIQKSWTDVYIERDGNQVRFKYSSPPEILKVRNMEMRQLLPVPIGFENIFFEWMCPWMPLVEVGYSCLFTHPMYHYDLPFFVMPGLVDSDVFNVGPGMIPFFLKKDFQGLIPSGTPMFQIIPIKREKWQSKKLNENDFVKNQKKFLNTKMFDRYKKLFWQKKEYN